MKLLGADQQPRLTGLTKLPGKSNYFLGNDPDRWWTDIPHYGRIQYHDVYPGIDLVYYGTQGELEYDFVVAPGADPSVIQLKFEGVRDVRIDARGDLVLETESGQIQQRKPFAYQHVNGVRRTISGAYLLRQDQTVSFELGDYDPTQPLVIDPVLIYSTLIGGSGQDFALAIDVDSSGNVYATGYTNSADFPAVGPIQSDFGGGSGDIFATKLNASGTELLYATYLGGSGSEFADIAVDAAGNAYLTGSTSSSNFPTANALQPTFGGGRRDSFVTKLNPTGSALIYSTYLGGSGAENEGSLGRIAVDAAGNASVTGITDSPDFPTKNALQPTYGGGVSDAYVAKLNPGGSGFAYSTYLGGSGVETEFSSGGIAVDFDGNAYVTGSTDSVDFPTANPLQAARSGAYDAFVTKLNPVGSAFIYSTYLGRDQGGAAANGIAVDAGGNAYVTGYTTGFTSSSSFPGAGPPPFPPGPGVLPFDGFVSKLNAAGSALVYSRYIATPRDDFAEGITVDAAGNAWVIGSTGGEFAVTPDALFPIGGGGSFVVQLDSAGDIVYATFFPPVADIAVDGSGNVYLTGSISNFALPLVTPGAFQTAFRGGVDVYVVKLGGEGVPVTTVSAADFQGRELAADSIVSSFAPDFAERVTQADRIPLPTELDGISITVIDSTLTEHLAGLIVVTPLQINWVMPPQVAEGPARVTVTTQDGRVFSGVVAIGAIAPALFSANADGMGVAAASILRIQTDGSQSTELIFDPNVNPPGRIGVPIDLGPETDQVFLVLFGTGIRGRGKKSAVSVTIGGEPVEVQFSGAQGEFVGLDQVNVGPLPRSLIGRGELDIALTVDDKQADIVTVTIGGGPPPVKGGLDAVFADFLSPNRVCVNDGSGNFTCSDVSTDANSTRDVALGDVDGDGDLDAVFANGSRNRVCLNDGSGNFTCNDVSTDANRTLAVALGDADGDGDLDAVFANINEGSHNRLCVNDGSSNFTCNDVSTDTGRTTEVALGDVDGDNDLDAVFAQGVYLGPQRLCLNDGSGNFTCSHPIRGAVFAYDVALGDVDEDGDLDAVFAQGGGTVRVRNQLCVNDGSGSFTCSDVSTDTNLTVGVALGDVDPRERFTSLGSSEFGRSSGSSGGVRGHAEFGEFGGVRGQSPNPTPRATLAAGASASHRNFKKVSPSFQNTCPTRPPSTATTSPYPESRACRSLGRLNR